MSHVPRSRQVTIESASTSIVHVAATQVTVDRSPAYKVQEVSSTHVSEQSSPHAEAHSLSSSQWNWHASPHSRAHAERLMHVQSSGTAHSHAGPGQAGRSGRTGPSPAQPMTRVEHTSSVRSNVMPRESRECSKVIIRSLLRLRRSHPPTARGTCSSSRTCRCRTDIGHRARGRRRGTRRRCRSDSPRTDGRTLHSGADERRYRRSRRRTRTCRVHTRSRTRPRRTTCTRRPAHRNGASSRSCRCTLPRCE
jgi:hypothetical protein